MAYFVAIADERIETLIRRCGAIAERQEIGIVLQLYRYRPKLSCCGNIDDFDRDVNGNCGGWHL